MTKKQQTMLERLAELKEQQKNIAAAVLKAEADLIAELEALGQKSVTSGGSLTGTLVKGSTITIDDVGLKKALGATMWKKVTKPVLDKERLEAEITVGNIDANVVAAVSTEKDRKPFIKVSGSLPQISDGDTKPVARKRVVRPKK